MERVAAWMHWPIVTVAARTRVADAQRIAAEHGVRHLVVIEADDMVGVLCTCDLRTAKPDDRVGDRMSRRVRTVEPGAALETAADVMRRSDVGCLPVTVSGKLVGMLTRGDLRRAGFPDPALSDRRCAACGSHRHVRTDPSGVTYCCECRERAHERSSSDFTDEETGAGD